MKKLIDQPVVFFGNEKLATGDLNVKPLIKKAVEKAGFKLEKIITDPVAELGSHKAQMAVLAAYGHIVPKSVLDQFPLGIINIHPSLLPAYRGPTPIEQAILDGVAKTGVSIMQLTAGMDEGPIYKQKLLHLNGTETKPELVEKLQKLGADMLVEILPSIFNGQLKPRQQPHPDRATYSHKISKADGVIDWHKSAEQIEREVRAFAGWPNSRTTLGGKEVIITQAHTVPTSGDEPEGSLNVPTNINAPVMKTGNGSLCIDRLKPVGKKEMSAAEFLRGYGQNLS